MPAIDTETPALNPAKFSALQVAQSRADRERVEIRVYVARSTTRELYTGDRAKGLNVYFVRRADEGEPLDSELFRTVTPASVTV